MMQSQTNNTNTNSFAHKITYIALLTSLALIFSYIEAIIPFNPGIPGIKLGIANIVSLVALYKSGWKDAICITILRIVISSLLFSGIFTMFYSLSGAIISLTAMILLKKSKLFSIVGVSMAGGVLHNLGQLILASLIIEDLKIFFYFPALLFSGIISGIIIGIIANLILSKTASLNFNKNSNK